MTSEFLNHVFSSLCNLERYHSRLAAQVGGQSQSQLSCSITEQGKVLKHMRRIANMLQLQIAKSDNAGAARSLNLYYCLHAMVRPEIFSAYGKAQVPESLEIDEIDKSRAN